ncbi:Tn3 family transposase [Streptomyces sp. NPDC006992]|uniref:Tn3 family transposase n=1 Tax=Streptomyces sp. NPDC006992 TaxID=3155601 RepID=UPI0033D505FA
MTTHHPTERRIPRSAHTRLLARPGAFRAPGAPGPLAPDGRGHRREDTRPASRALTPFPFQWIGFGNPGVIADNDPIEQEKALKLNALLTNAVIFHNALDIAEIARQLLEGDG